MIDVCAVMGGSTYVNDWLNINLLVVLVSMLIGAVVYAFSKIMPAYFSSKVTGAVRYELTQAVLSLVIIAILLAMSETACNISASISTSLTGSALSPFQYADYYVGNLSTNAGLGLLSRIYFLSTSYSIEATIFDVTYGQFLNSYSPLSFSFETSFMSISFAPSFALGKVFKFLSNVYIDIFSILLITVIGALYIQWLLLPVLQYTAFVVVLPVALVMRSLGFVGGNLRNTANAVLALAIAAYLVYPLMVCFDSYAVSWIFSSSNPSYTYLEYSYALPSFSESTFFSTLPSQSLVSGNPATAPSYLASFLTSSSINLNPFAELGTVMASAWDVPATTDMIAKMIAKFLFIGIFMFAINIGVTAGLAMGLAKGLSSGVEGMSTFWGNL